MLNVQDIRSLFLEFGGRPYCEEPITQLEHALQCGALAEAAGESKAFVAAAFMHDLGHMLARSLVGSTRTPAEPAGDDVHQYLVLPFLRGVFPDEVLNPIKLHVEAKRCLCVLEPKYWEGLTPTSRRSLEMQGGVMSSQEASTFLARPGAADALKLRNLDDRAKVPNASTPNLEHFLQIVESVSTQAVADVKHVS